jgi:hypothetical protein
LALATGRALVILPDHATCDEVPFILGLHRDETSSTRSR